MRLLSVAVRRRLRAGAACPTEQYSRNQTWADGSGKADQGVGRRPVDLARGPAPRNLRGLRRLEDLVVKVFLWRGARYCAGHERHLFTLYLQCKPSATARNGRN